MQSACIPQNTYTSTNSRSPLKKDEEADESLDVVEGCALGCTKSGYTSLDGASIQDETSRIACGRRRPICSSMEVASDVLVGNEMTSMFME